MLTCYEAEPEPAYFHSDYEPELAPPFVPEDEPTEVYLASVASEPVYELAPVDAVNEPCCAPLPSLETQNDTYVLAPMASAAAQNVQDLVLEYSRFNHAEISAQIHSIGHNYRILRRMQRQHQRGDVLETQYGQLRLV